MTYVCVCVCGLVPWLCRRRLIVGFLLICWSNRCQNTPGAVTLEGQESRRQCVLYSVVHRTSAGRHPLITAAAFIGWPAASFPLRNQDHPKSWLRWRSKRRVRPVFLVAVAASSSRWCIGCVLTGQTWMCHTEIAPRKTHWETGAPQDWSPWSNGDCWQWKIRLISVKLREMPQEVHDDETHYQYSSTLSRSCAANLLFQLHCGKKYLWAACILFLDWRKAGTQERCSTSACKSYRSFFNQTAK